MAQRVRDILLRIRGDASDAENDLHQLARELQRFDGITAEATVDINTQAAERKVKSAENAVKAFGRMSEEAKVDLQARAAQVKLDGLNRNLDNLQKREVTPKVEIAIGKTVAQIERVEAQLDRLDRRRVDIDVDVDRNRVGGIASAVGAGAGAALAGISAGAQGLGLLVSAASRGIPILGGLGQLFIQLGISGAALGPVFLILVPIIGVVLLGAVVSLTGAVVALGASFLTAAAGVGVLAVALAGAFGPVILVAIAAMARFAKILEAVKSAEDGAAEGARGVRDANRAQADAQRNAVDASARVRTTAVEAYRAWRDAAEETSDAIRGIAQAELSRDQARLNVEQAEQNLKDLRDAAGLADESLDGLFKKFTDVSYRPQNLIAAIQKSEVGKRAGGGDELDIAQGILDLRQARLSEQDAIDGVSDAHTRLEEARTAENEFIQEGIRAYEPYTAAVKANEDAQRALKDATEATNEARQKQNEALKDLTPRERTLVGVIVALKETLTDAFRPATNRIFAGVISFLRDLGDFAKDTRVRGGLTAIGRAIGGMFREFGRVLRQRETRDAFEDLARAGARLIRTLTPVFTSLFRLVMRVAQVAMPWLLEIVGDIARGIRNWANAADRSGIQRFVDRVKDSFNVWKRIASELWRIIKAFFSDAAKSGDTLAGHIADILRDFRKWLDENPDGIRRFFQDAAAFGKDLADSMRTVASVLQWMINAKNDIKDIFETIARPIKKIPRVARPFPLNLVPGLQSGGLIPGTGTGDRIPILAEPGEFMIRRSVTQAIGVNRLNLLNAGNINALGGSRGGMVINEQIINLPPAPGHDQLGDPRHQAVQLARELRRRGQVGIAGGGYP